MGEVAVLQRGFQTGQWRGQLVAGGLRDGRDQRGSLGSDLAGPPQRGAQQHFAHGGALKVFVAQGRYPVFPVHH